MYANATLYRWNTASKFIQLINIAGNSHPEIWDRQNLTVLVQLFKNLNSQKINIKLTFVIRCKY